MSTEEQATGGTGLERQREDVERYAERHQITLVAQPFMDEGRSGDLPWQDRPGLAEAIGAIRSGEADVVVASDANRLSRDLLELLLAVREAEHVGGGVVIANKHWDSRTDDPFMLHVEGAVAERDKRDTLERMRRGLVARARAGQWPGGPPPFGYRLEDRRLAVDPDEARVIREAARLILEGGTTWTVARDLNSRGLLPRSGNPWTHVNLRRALRAPVLGGSWIYDSRSGPVEIVIEEPVLDPDTFAVLQVKLDSTSTQRRSGLRTYPLSGRLFGACGAPFHGIYRHDRASASYRCRHFRECDCKPVLADPLERLVWGEVCDYLTDPERVAADLENATTPEDVTLAIKRKRRQIQRRRDTADRAIAALIAAGAANERVEGVLTRLQADEAEDLAELERLRAQQAAADASTQQVALLERVYARMQEIRDADLEVQAATLEALDVRVYIDDWGVCPECDGRGKLPKGGVNPALLPAYTKMGLVTTGGVICPRCRAARAIPAVRIVGNVADPVSKRSTC